MRLPRNDCEPSAHLSKYTPWKIKFCAAFDTLGLAQHFEQYLKSGSGHAFSKRHFGL